MKKDEYKLLGYGLLTALLMGLVLTPILARDINFPKVNGVNLSDLSGVDNPNATDPQNSTGTHSSMLG